jgi:fimbrial chaperone protein
MTTTRAALLLAAILAAPLAHAAKFGVSPLIMTLGKAKSASITVSNEDKSPASFQVSVKKWTQGPKGEDVYEDSKDLVVFPQQLEVGPGQKKLVRVGFEGSPPKREVAYRVFIEELPPAANPLEGRKGQVQVLGRFGLPVFVKDPASKPKLAIDDVSTKSGNVTAKFSNSGDSALRVNRLSAGTTAIDGFGGGWLLAGSSREFSAALPAAACKPGKVTFHAESLGGVKATKDATIAADGCKAA